MKKLLIITALLFSMAAHGVDWPTEHPENAYSSAISHQSKTDLNSWRLDLYLWYQEDGWWLKIVATDTSKNTLCSAHISVVQDALELAVALDPGTGFPVRPCQSKVDMINRLNVPIDYKRPFDFYYYDPFANKEIHFEADASDFADFIPPEPESTTRLSNISTRGRVGATPDLLYGGFIVTGEGSATIYIKGGAVDDGLDTTLRIVDSEGNAIAENDDWQNDARLNEVPDHLKPKKPTDSGLLLDLSAGTYNALVSAKGKEGHAIVSVWEVK